jgi:hypothetical protein
MRAVWTCLIVLALFPLTTLSARAGEQKETKSALESHPDGWIDLTANGLKDWKRVSIPPKSKLKDGNPWSYDDKTGTILCHGPGYHEMLLYNKKLADGVFHVEWRFKKIEDKKGYNSGVYARNSEDGAIWHQAQVGSKNVGHIFGDTPIEDGKRKRISTPKLKGEQRGKEAGEWNTYEITCQGKTMSLWVNGAVTTIWDACPVADGYFGMEAEGWVIEFKSVKFKPLDK